MLSVRALGVSKTVDGTRPDRGLLTVVDVAVLDLLGNLGPHGRVDLLVLVHVLWLELDDLGEAPPGVADPRADWRGRLDARGRAAAQRRP
jgi:hypothetical protein